MKKTFICLATLSALTSSAAHADITFNGFASVVGGMTTSSKDQLYNFDDNLDFKQGSLFALQASSDLDNGLGVTLQLTAKGADDWDPEFKWAYVSYDASDEFRILAGRQRAPFYMYSDYLDVSYAYPWISPPKGVYNLIFDTFDGLGGIYTTSFGNVDATFHGIYGRNTDDIEAFSQQVKPDITDLTGLSSTFVYDWLTLRASYFVADVSIPLTDLQTLSAGWQQAGFNDIAQQTNIAEDDASFLEFGFQMHFDNLQIVGEYTNLDIDNSPLVEEESYYVMAGYQFDRILLHLTYGKDDNTISNYTSGVPYGIAPTLDFLKGTTEEIITNQISKENYLTFGVRYDFHDSAAVKFEYTDFENETDSSYDAGLFRMALVTVF
ncbi:porin [Thalassotalea sp. 1_MG-2023]|uniref:porin n=1 Tax=Thalassotalea sp. 1_MG-2023 TaxID=3062680 RepID=UPI0026E41BD6|nr:porin [Thalassotalea sp. 1_MG-2023]MDO6427597.1 porin [Thalassotalea sp. 1_MG-2023]